MTTFADQVLGFLTSLRLPQRLLPGVSILNPYRDTAVREWCRQFYHRYYSDNHARTLLLGINPGRFGGGLTGIPFTDPVKLEKDCGIPNTMVKKSELSADFIYRLIYAYGGLAAFYQQFYISSVSPLGFIRDGKNLNYYDEPALAGKLERFIVDSLRTQLGFGIRRDVCFCLGEGKNFQFLSQLNDEHRLFHRIVPLAHPRFIMQYRRKKMDDYVAEYISKLNEANTPTR